MKRCPSFDDLSRAFSEGNAATKRHVGGCPRCAATWRDLGAVRDAASAPVPPLSDAAAERVAQALWARTSPSAAVRTAKPLDLRLVGAAVLTIVALLLWWAPWYPRAPQAARVTPIADADYERSVRYDGERARQEIVRVRRGHLRLDATEGVPLRLLTSDVRVEGTAFDVVVVDERLVELTVRAGSVALWRGEGPPRLLQVGERWTAGGAANADGRSAVTEGVPATAEPTVGAGAAGASAQPRMNERDKTPDGFEPWSDRSSAAPVEPGASARWPRAANPGEPPAPRAPARWTGSEPSRPGASARRTGNTTGPAAPGASAGRNGHATAPAARVSAGRNGNTTGPPAPGAFAGHATEPSAPGASAGRNGNTSAPSARGVSDRTPDGRTGTHDAPTDAATRRGARGAEPAPPSPAARDDASARAPKGGDDPSAEAPSAPAADARPRSDAELAFERGWSAFRAQDLDDAARAFAKVEQIAPSSALAEDAAYWRAIALLRAKREEALQALRAFVARHPKATRAPEVWVLLGWSELARSNVDAARDAFVRGRAEGGPAVRAEADRGLAAIDDG
ncbi:MAG: tetratricopeptide repeat protein [Deltaproteobacteria bacterium]|jgi:TolA-binding protein